MRDRVPCVRASGQRTSASSRWMAEVHLVSSRGGLTMSRSCVRGDELWLEVMESLDRDDSNEELLSLFLTESSSESSPTRSDTPDRNEGGRLRSTLSREVGVSRTPPPLKRKRHQRRRVCDPITLDRVTIRTLPRHARPRHEILLLRQQVLELETMLALLQQRQQALDRTGRRPPVTSTSASTVANGTSATLMDMWKAVAMRQYEHLRDAAVQNHILRSQVLTQKTIMRGFERLAERALYEVQTTPSEFDLVDFDSLAFTRKCEEMVARATAAFDTLSTVFQAPPFISPESGEFRSIDVSPDSSVKAGQHLVASSARHIAPLPLRQLADAMWCLHSKRGVSPGRCSMQHEFVGDSPDTHFIVFSLEVPMPRGMQLISALAVRCRRRLPSSESIVTMMSPLAQAKFEIKAYTMIRPHATSKKSASRQGEVNEVLVRMESTRTHIAIGGSEALMLRDFAISVHSHTHDEQQHRIDASLLRHP